MSIFRGVGITCIKHTSPVLNLVATFATICFKFLVFFYYPGVPGLSIAM